MPCSHIKLDYIYIATYVIVMTDFINDVSFVTKDFQCQTP